MPTSSQQIEITGLTEDSRKVKTGFLFAAMQGTKTDGVNYIDDAIKRGASVILAPLGTKISNKDVLLIEDENPRKRMALMASCFYGKQPENIAAVTGTNGKTSVSDFVRQIWKYLGKKSASIGTLGVKISGEKTLSFDDGITTPDSSRLHKILKNLADNDINHVAMEATSHGLAMHRLDGVKIKIAAFTNLTRDHLDYHKDMDNYLSAKKRLFSDFINIETAVLNADIPEFEALAEICEERGHEIISYGINGKEIRIIEQTPNNSGQLLKLEILGKQYSVELPLAGAFQAMNTACAIGISLADGNDINKIIEAVNHLKGVAGRIEKVATLKNRAEIYVDFAHTPDALENVLNALRPHTKEKLAVVFGCGGDRDKGKRPLMGEIAARLCDRVTITEDNPRTENPEAIRADVLRLCPEAVEISDRAEAINLAVSHLKSGDVLVIAGKGHETGQKIGNKIHPFDDKEQALLAATKIGIR